jgi:hypothetical protein
MHTNMIVRRMSMFLFTVSIGYLHTPPLFAQDQTFSTEQTVKCPEARQGVAVGAQNFYAINSKTIGQYDKQTGRLVNRWDGGDNIIHLDSGVVVGNRLYCAHSNYPALPMMSSIEIFDASTLQHVDSHDFGVYRGSLTWLDRHEGFWWAAFAHYERYRDTLGRGPEWTTVVKYDDQWCELGVWALPVAVLDRMHPMSNSGGSWGPDGLLYLTGHDRPEVYRLQLPAKGTTLELIDTLPLDILGQGIAWDRTRPGTLYGIRRKDLHVIIATISNQEVKD